MLNRKQSIERRICYELLAVTMYKHLFPAYIWILMRFK